MVALTWDQTGERTYETGVDHGVLYQLDETGEYVDGVPWNGLTTVTESPSGAEASPQYADNIKYLNLVSTEMFGCTIEAFTYPPQFEQNDGSMTPTAGVTVGQQVRKTFGFCYRSLKGNDTQGNAHGYKLHLIWGALAAPSEKAYATVNDSPEAITFSWEVTTTPITVGTVLGTEYSPTASMTIDSTLVDPAKLTTLLEYLYGTESEDATLPSPADVITIMSSTLTLATPTVPTYNNTTDVITIPTVTGVEYYIDGELMPPGETDPITANTLVRARPATGYKFPVPVQDEWLITFS